MWKAIRWTTIFTASVAMFAQIIAYVPNNYLKVLYMLNVIFLVVFAMGFGEE